MNIGLIIRLIIVFGVIALLLSAYYKGRNDESARITNQLKEDRIVLLKDGKVIDEQVLNSDDNGICTILGGC